MANNEYVYDEIEGRDPYHFCLEFAGIKVLAFEKFGSYQGDWLALVKVNNKLGFIKDHYGSCDGCDAFQGEVSYHFEKKTGDPQGYKAQDLINFGNRYKDNILTYEKTLSEVSKYKAWDSEALMMIKWVESHKEKFK